MTNSVLEVSGVRKSFEGIRAVDDVSLRIMESEIVSIIGPNGSGKTTLFNCISGFMKPESGSVTLDGRLITGLEPSRVARLGLVRTFQSVRMFSSLSVEANLVLCVQQHQGDSVLGRLFRSRTVRRNEAVARSRAVGLLDRVGLAEYRNSPVGTLSYGQRKLVSILGGIMAEPRIVLLDEPAAAVNPSMVGRIGELLKELNDSGQTIALIEHNMNFVMSLSGSVMVMEAGKTIAQGTPASVKSNPRVLEAYLGKS